jgi:hypothetical protein
MERGKDMLVFKCGCIFAPSELCTHHHALTDSKLEKSGNHEALRYMKILTPWPKPYSIMSCPVCDEVALLVSNDFGGQNCAECGWELGRVPERMPRVSSP